VTTKKVSEANPSESRRDERRVKVEFPEDAVEETSPDQTPHASDDEPHVSTLPAPEPQRVPTSAIGIDFARDGTYAYQTPPANWNFDFMVLINGMRVEHVAQDVDGCWLYRRQPSNLK